MSAGEAQLFGELREWPTKERMAAILRAAGLQITVGRYAIRLQDLSHFVFDEYGGDLGEPTIDADASSAEILREEAQRVSKALGQAGVAHRFEIYDERGEMVYYLHHDWPRTSET